MLVEFVVEILEYIAKFSSVRKQRGKGHEKKVKEIVIIFPLPTTD